MTFVNSVDVTMVNDDLLSSDHDLPNGTLGTSTNISTSNATTITTISVTTDQEYDPLVFWSVNAFILTLLVTVCVWCQFCGGNECLLKLNRRDLSELEYATRQRQQQRQNQEDDEAIKKEPPEERKRRLLRCFERTQVLMVVEHGDYQENTEMPCGHDLLSSQPCCLLDDEDSSLDGESLVPASTLLAAAAARHGGSTAAYLVAGMASASALDVPEAAIVPSPTGRTRLGSYGGAAKVDGDNARRDYMPRAPALGDGADTGADVGADVVDAGAGAGEEERSGEKVRLHLTKCAVEHEEERAAADKVELDLSRMEQGHCDAKQNNCRSTIVRCMPKEPVVGSSDELHPTSTATRGEPAGGAKLLVEFSAQDQQVSVTEEPSDARQDSVVGKTSSLHPPGLAVTKKPDLPEEGGVNNGPFTLSPEEPDEDRQDSNAHQCAEANVTADSTEARKADEHEGRAVGTEDFTTSAEHLEDAGQKFGYLILRRRALQSSTTSRGGGGGGASGGGCSMIVGKTPNCCAVCLAPYEVGETVVWSNQNDVCPHAFHLDCIVDWLVKTTQNNCSTPCPCCRQEFTTALEPYRSNDDDDKDNSNSSNSTSNNRAWHMTEVF